MLKQLHDVSKRVYNRPVTLSYHKRTEPERRTFIKKKGNHIKGPRRMNNKYEINFRILIKLQLLSDYRDDYKSTIRLESERDESTINTLINRGRKLSFSLRSHS